MPNTRFPAASEQQAGEVLNRMGKSYSKTKRNEIDGKWSGFTYFYDMDGREFAYYQDDLKIVVLLKKSR